MVAELCPAFLRAALGITPELREDLAHCPAVLKADNRAILTAARQAQKAVEALQALQHAPAMTG